MRCGFGGFGLRVAVVSWVTANGWMDYYGRFVWQVNWCVWWTTDTVSCRYWLLTMIKLGANNLVEWSLLPSACNVCIVPARTMIGWDERCVWCVDLSLFSWQTIRLMNTTQQFMQRRHRFLMISGGSLIRIF